MKKTVFIVCTFLFTIFSAYSQTADLSIIVTSIRTNSGNIKIGIFNSEESFKKKTDPVAGVVLKCDDTIIQYKFRNLIPDTLAIAVFNDENSDDTLNTKKLGIPTEGVGSSGVQNTKLSKPKFENASFYFENDTTIRIQLVYPRK